MKKSPKHKYVNQQYLFTQRIKFLCSVADEYELICPAPVIFYDPVTYLPAFPIDSLHEKYRADFLIRHRTNGQALLIELHPASMVNDTRLRLRRSIAQNYIACKGYDWQYRCLFQEYVHLSEEQSSRFESYSHMKTNKDQFEWLIDYLLLMERLKPAVFRSPKYSLLDFLIHSILPENA
jgi:hypothetical protein